MADRDEELRERKYPRVRESCQVKYHVVEEAMAGPLRERGVAVNISGGGMCFAADEPLVPGETIACEVTLPQLPTPVRSLGKVCWCEPSDRSPGKYDVGVEFWWIGWADPEVQETMLGYINKKLDEMGVDEEGNPA